MTTSTDTNPAMPEPEPANKSLAEVVEPLVDFLNRAYPSQLEEFYVAPFGQYGQEEQPFNEISIDLNVEEHMPELTQQALWTLIRKSGSNSMWNSRPRQIAEEGTPYQEPLRFKLVRNCYYMETNIQWLVHLVIDHLGDDFDVEAAEHQIALLTGYLEDEGNLDELPPEAVAMFAAPPETLIRAGNPIPFRNQQTI